MNIENEIYELLENITKKKIPKNLSINLFEEGILDSLEFITFIDLIGQKYNIQISTEDLFSDDFLNILGIISYIKRKIGSLID